MNHVTDTPISNKAAFFADARLGKTCFVVLHKDAQELERLCNELFEMIDMNADAKWPREDELRAKYAAMKVAK